MEFVGSLVLQQQKTVLSDLVYRMPVLDQPSTVHQHLQKQQQKQHSRKQIHLLLLISHFKTTDHHLIQILPLDPLSTVSSSADITLLLHSEIEMVNKHLHLEWWILLRLELHLFLEFLQIFLQLGWGNKVWVVQAGTLDVVGCILEAWLADKGFAVGPSSSATSMPRNGGRGKKLPIYRERCRGSCKLNNPNSIVCHGLLNVRIVIHVWPMIKWAFILFLADYIYIFHRMILWTILLPRVQHHTFYSDS